MAVYIINHSDPLKQAFTLPAGVFDGPGSATPKTSLRLYGQGTLNWGEGFNENVLRLAENFAGATPPIYPLEGQFWYLVRLYWFNSVGSTWWRWNYLISDWDDITASVSGPAMPGAPNVGDYWYDGTTLSRWDSAYQQIPVGWMVRYFSENTVDPTPSDYPARQVLAWDGLAWNVVSGVVTQATTPSSPQIGQLWYDTITDELKVWNGTTWVNVILASGGGTLVMSGDIDMNGFKIINLLSPPVNPNDAASKAYVDTKVAKAGDTMSGTLDMGNNLISNVANPVSVGDALNLQTGDTRYAVIGPITPKDGDIQVVGSVISMYASGSWRQIFPAQYS